MVEIQEKKNEREREREREPFLYGKNMHKKWKIYSKMMEIRRVKTKEDEGAN